MTEQEGTYMLVVQGNKTGEAKILLPTPNGGVGNGLRGRPSGQQRGWSQSSGAVSGEPGLTRMCMSVGGRGRREESEPPAPEGQGYQSTAPSRFP